MRNLLLVLFVVACARAQGNDAGANFGQPMSNLTRSLKNGTADLLEATRNREFLSKPLTAEQVEALKSYLGRDVANRALGAGELAGHTVQDLMKARPEIAKDFPQVISYLAAQGKQQGVRVYGNDRDPQPLEVASPGRVIPNDDLTRAAGRGDAGENVRDYLKSNFSMDDAQMRSYSAFLDLAAGRDPAALAAGKKGDSGPVMQSLANTMRGMPAGGKGGLYLPNADTLGKLSQLMQFLDAYHDEPGADASRFRGPDGRTLGDLVAEFDPDSSAQHPVDQMRRMSESEVQQLVSSLMGKVVKNDLEGPNRFLFELNAAWVKPPEEKKAKTGGSLGYTMGNGKVRALNEELYRKLILEKHSPSERDRLELESDGEFFAVRGRPADIVQKHYDPPIDMENMYFGAGMNLSGKKREQP